MYKMLARRLPERLGSTKWLLNGCRHRSSHQRIQPELTSVRYKVERGPYAAINDAHAAFFTRILGQDRVLTEPDECDSYNVDWLHMVKGYFASRSLNPDTIMYACIYYWRSYRLLMLFLSKYVELSCKWLVQCWNFYLVLWWARWNCLITTG